MFYRVERVVFTVLLFCTQEADSDLPDSGCSEEAMGKYYLCHVVDGN